MGDRVKAEEGPLDQALTFLFARTTGAYKFGLERTLALLEALGNPHRAVPVIHVAGTNGKGSSLAMAEALLLGRGLRVAKYTSPHLVDFRERFLIDRVPIEGDVVVEFVQRWTPLVEKLGATFFEATTALAFDVFAKAKVDVALIETGLGGRLDSTNVVDPVSAGVTSIGWDHMEYLGHTLEAIAMEKAGVFKRGKPAVIGELHPDVRKQLAQRATAVGAKPFVVAEHCSISDIEVSANGTSVTFNMFGETERLQTPLAGRHQAFNLAFTLGLLHEAGKKFAFSLREAAPLLKGVSLPGRFQRSGRYLFDVAHNADGARVLADTLHAVAPKRPVRVLFCALRDKEWRDMLAALAPVVDSFVLTNAPTAPASRAWDLGQVEEFVQQRGISAQVVPDFDDALRCLEDVPSAVITGSFHTVGDAMARLQVSPFAF
ncbi:MAG TPA: folylpolyglutamate synthase/dihydrofolate synthase family protein [Gemmatimonadaceae bacterium]